MQKIKAIIFDFDETLCSMAEAHYKSLNDALSLIDSKFTISHDDQIKRFEGLSTRKKLEILINERNFPADKADYVFNLKQQLTIKAIEETVNFDSNLYDLFTKLKSEGYLLYVASNAIRATIVVGLTKLGIIEFFDKLYSNEDVSLTKPHPQIYLKVMMENGLIPFETLIVEDSKNGRTAAYNSGAHLCTVDNPKHTTYEHIKKSLNKKHNRYSWTDSKLNIVLPCAGNGSRFALTGKYNVPKPLIDVNGKPMIQRVVENLNVDANYIFIVQKSHYDQYNLQTFFNLLVPGCTVITVDGVTEGAACTTLLAKNYINNEDHLLIINSDQYIDNFDSGVFLNDAMSRKVDGSIITFEKHNDPKWSYVNIKNEYITNVVEKKVISSTATIGAYWFNKGSEYVSAAEEMINSNDRCGKEFYVAPVYNYLIKNNKKIINYNIKPEDFYGLGVPEDLEYYLERFEK